jgi:zinc D-Ala-D-Ala dipeptidase
MIVSVHVNKNFAINNFFTFLKLIFFTLLNTTMIIACNRFHSLIDIQKVIPNIKLDIRYATTNNFTKKAIYPIAKCFLQKPAALALKKVENELKSIGLGLKVFDGYRPLSIQHIFWEIMPDERYVANPKNGSRHNRGCAVDVTLIRPDGSDLMMPTEFDDFTEKAHSNYIDLPKEIIQNRTLLRRIMERHGFTALPTEWWHFDFKGWEKYPLLDIPLEEL